MDKRTTIAISKFRLIFRKYAHQGEVMKTEYWKKVLQVRNEGGVIEKEEKVVVVDVYIGKAYPRIKSEPL